MYICYAIVRLNQNNSHNVRAKFTWFFVRKKKKIIRKIQRKQILRNETIFAVKFH